METITDSLQGTERPTLSRSESRMDYYYYHTELLLLLILGSLEMLSGMFMYDIHNGLPVLIIGMWTAAYSFYVLSWRIQGNWHNKPSISSAITIRPVVSYHLVIALRLFLLLCCNVAQGVILSSLVLSDPLPSSELISQSVIVITYETLLGYATVGLTCLVYLITYIEEVISYSVP